MYCDPSGLLENRFRPSARNRKPNRYQNSPRMKKGKNRPKIGFSPDFLFLGYFFPIFILEPISGPIWFPISGRRPETYFLAGRLDRKACSESIAKLYCACFFLEYHSFFLRYFAEWGIAQMCLCDRSSKGGYRTTLGEW